MRQSLQKVAQFVGSIAHRIRVRSALNPMLWMCGIVSPVCFTAGWFFRDQGWISLFLVFLGSTPILLTCAGFVYFALEDPDRLQSEDFQLRRDTLRVAEQKDQIEFPPGALEQVVGTTREEARRLAPVTEEEEDRGEAADQGDEANGDENQN